MATERSFVEYVFEQAGLADALTCRKMFGEYGLYLDGKFVAIAADNTLFLKPTQAGRGLLPSVIEGKPYPEARPWWVLDEILDDPDLLRRLIVASAAELQPPPKKAGRARRPGTRSGYR